MNSTGLRHSTRSLFVSVAALGVCGGMLGCPVLNTEHCAYPEGGGTVCAEGLMCSKCAIDNNGCVAPENVSVDCKVDADSTGPSSETSTTTGDPTLTTTLSTDPETSLSTADDTTTGPQVSTTTGTESTDPDTTATTNTTGTDCDPDEGNAGCETPLPYCNDVGMCIGCGELDCATEFPEQPVCHPDNGLCVECNSNDDCGQAEPFCDLGTATCQTCTMHEHCPESACNLETGECFPEDNVIFVRNANTGCSDAPGNTGLDESNPICKLSIALSRVTPEKWATIKISQGQLAQTDSNVVPPGVTVAIRKHGNQPVTLARAGTESALSVSGDSHVFVYQINVFSQTKGGTSQLVACADSSLWLDRMSIYDGKVGVYVRDCKLHMRRDVVFQNSMGGIDLTQMANLGMSKLWLENSFVTDNGDSFGIRASKNSFLEINYSTIAANTKTVAVAQVACTSVPDDNMTLRNSVLADNLNSYVTGCKWTDAGDNYYADMVTTMLDLVDKNIASSVSGGIVRAKTNGALMAKQAIWRTGDPPGDYDADDNRPTEDNTPDWAGADVP